MRRTLSLLAFAFGACDDAPVQPFPERFDGGSVDASLSSSTMDAASFLDGGYVEEVDAGTYAGDAAALPYARGVVRFTPGANAGFGSNKLPDVVLGPPTGKGDNAGSLDVLSLGVGGEIVLDFGARTIVDAPGPDFIVFENPFWAGGASAASVYAEPGQVSVSNDLTSWQTFPCSPEPTQPGLYPGCAGWTPTQAYNPFTVLPLDPATTGGDAFDLATVSATSARYVRVRDLSTSGQGTSAGFDLDAVGIIHASPP